MSVHHSWGEIRCQFIILGGKSGVRGEIRCQFIILGKSGVSSSFLPAGKSGVSSSFWGNPGGSPVSEIRCQVSEIRCQFIILARNPVSVHHSCPKR